MDKNTDLIRRDRLGFKDVLLIIVSIIGVAGFIGQYYVNSYRINELQTHQIDQDKSIQTLTEGQREYQVFRGKQDLLNLEMSAHMLNQSIHVTPERQQLMVQQSLAPLTDQITRMTVQNEERQKQMDSIEKMLKDLSNKPALNR